MKWLANTTDYRDGKNQHQHTLMLGQTEAEAQQHWEVWTKGKVFGPPQASEECSQEQLEGWGLIGVYVEEET